MKGGTYISWMAYIEVNNMVNGLILLLSTYQLKKRWKLELPTKTWHLEPFSPSLVCLFLQKKTKKKTQDLTLLFSWCLSWFLLFNEWRKRERNFFLKGTGSTWILSETYFFYFYFFKVLSSVGYSNCIFVVTASKSFSFYWNEP